MDAVRGKPCPLRRLSISEGQSKSVASSATVRFEATRRAIRPKRISNTCSATVVADLAIATMARDCDRIRWQSSRR